MKKYLLNLMAILMVAIVSVSLVSCECDDDDDNSGVSSRVSGLYYYEDGGDSRTAYNFVNNNTVEVYYSLSQDSNAKWAGERGVAFPLKSGWYYWTGNKYIYSYYIIDDMVVIGSDRIMTISGNTLVYNDMGVVLYKWD